VPPVTITTTMRDAVYWEQIMSWGNFFFKELIIMFWFKLPRKPTARRVWIQSSAGPRRDCTAHVRHKLLTVLTRSPPTTATVVPTTITRRALRRAPLCWAITQRAHSAVVSAFINFISTPFMIFCCQLLVAVY
jgi:hypothetical protein